MCNLGFECSFLIPNVHRLIRNSETKISFSRIRPIRTVVDIIVMPVVVLDL